MSRRLGMMALVYTYCNPLAARARAQPLGVLLLSSIPHFRWVRSPLPLVARLCSLRPERLGRSRSRSTWLTLALVLSLPRYLSLCLSLCSWLGSWPAAPSRPALGLWFWLRFRPWSAPLLASLVQALRRAMNAESTEGSFGLRLSESRTHNRGLPPDLPEPGRLRYDYSLLSTPSLTASDRKRPSPGINCLVENQ